MIWTISNFREFQKCTRKWFYSEKMASWSLKNPMRREVFLLSNLTSIEAWRGNIVDYIISNCIIPRILRKQQLIDEEVIKMANKLTRDRYNFAINKRYRENGMKKSDHDYDYSALYPIEYPDPKINLNEKLKIAWSEIEISLRNFLHNKDLINYLKEAKQLIVQRPLLFKLNECNIKGIPDLIAFFDNKPPHIFDWKVHFYGTKTYDEQLMIYAIALKNSNHKDFPIINNNYSLNDYKISEYQLYKDIIRNYLINDDFIENTTDFIADSVEQMRLYDCCKPFDELNIDDFETTKEPRNCGYCPYKKYCWEEI
ncbi:MAG: PD-(D/E)XK nuclease family protein [Bacteroidales bacterium]|nr:PD-(D/E)XK nuclease family protein [Bacteroidales bacterium]